MVEEQDSALVDQGSVWLPDGIRAGDRVRLVLNKPLTAAPARIALRTAESKRELAAKIDEVETSGTGAWRRWTTVVARVDDAEVDEPGFRWSVYER